MHRDINKPAISLQPTARKLGEISTVQQTINISPFTIKQVIVAVTLSVWVCAPKSTKLQAVQSDVSHNFPRSDLVNAIRYSYPLFPYKLTTKDHISHSKQLFRTEASFKNLRRKRKFVRTSLLEIGTVLLPEGESRTQTETCHKSLKMHAYSLSLKHTFQFIIRGLFTSYPIFHIYPN